MRPGPTHLAWIILKWQVLAGKLQTAKEIEAILGTGVSCTLSLRNHGCSWLLTTQHSRGLFFFFYIQ